MTESKRRGAGSDERLAVALAAGATRHAAAEAAGMSERTARRRAHEPHFAALLQEVNSEYLQQAAGSLAAGVGDAVATMLELIHSNNEMVRLQAARAIYADFLKGHERMSFEHRLSLVENRNSL